MRECSKQGDSVPETVDDDSRYTDDAVPDCVVTLDSRSHWWASWSDMMWGTICIWPRVVKNVFVCEDNADESIDRWKASQGMLNPHLQCCG